MTLLVDNCGGRSPILAEDTLILVEITRLIFFRDPVFTPLSLFLSLVAQFPQL